MTENKSFLDGEAIRLKLEYPKCAEEIDRELARIRKVDRESGESGGSVNALAMDLRSLIQGLPCARPNKTPKRKKSHKGAKRGRESRR